MSSSTEFIEAIRETVWSRIQFEDELPPSFDELRRHCQRTCWVSNMWIQATSNHMSLLDITQYGWRIVDGKLDCDWESVELGCCSMAAHVQVSQHAPHVVAVV